MPTQLGKDLLVGVTEAREKFKDLLAHVSEGADVVVLRRNQPVARIVNYNAIEKLITRIEDLEDYAAVLESKLESGGTVSHKEFMDELQIDPQVKG